MTYYVGLARPKNAPEQAQSIKWVRCIGNSKDQIRHRFKGDWKPEHVMTESELYAKYDIFWAGQIVRMAKSAPAKR